MREKIQSYYVVVVVIINNFSNEYEIKINSQLKLSNIVIICEKSKEK